MKTFLTIISFLSLISAVPAGVFTNSPDADSFVRSAATGSNYGGSGALSVSGANAVNGSGVANGVFDSFIRFNTAAMVASFNSSFGLSNWAISGATLQVTEVAAPAQTIFNRGVGSFYIRWITNDGWTEGTGMPMSPTTTGITYDDEATLLSASDLNLGIFTNAGVNGVISFSLALPPAFVSDLQAGGEVSLFMTAISPGTGFNFNSRSFTTTTARPVLVVSAAPQPVITAVSLAGTTVTLAGANGAAGGAYSVLAATNLSIPLNQWTPLITNVLSVNGTFAIAFTNTVTNASQYFLLKTQ